MSMWETRPVNVTLTIEIDGHVLTFDASGVAKGCLFHGQKPSPHRSYDVLESSIQGTVDSLTARVTKDAARFIANAYPVHVEGSDG